MAEIGLSPHRDDLVAIVDDEFFPYLSRWRWTFKMSSRKWKRAIYARRSVTLYVDGKRDRNITIYLHHEVLRLSGKRRPSELHTADHKNRNTLDNRADNLRWATKRTQTRNRVLHRSSASAGADHASA